MQPIEVTELTRLREPWAHIDWNGPLIEAFLSEVASGESVRSLAGTNGFPSEKAVYLQMAKDPSFATRMAAARATQQDREMDACIHMADEATPEDWQAVKLRIWARQWRASKLAPKKYGDKIGVEHSGQIAHKHLTLEELNQRIKDGEE